VSDAKAVSDFAEAVRSEKLFAPRSQAEKNPNYLQPIPCAVLRYQDKVLILKRNKPGHPLHNKYDIWAGGHVIESDAGTDILLNTLHRELTEEVFIKEAFDPPRGPVALIRTDEDARASRHIAVLYEITLKSEDVALALNQKEFRFTRGTSMSGRLVPINELAALYNEMGNWSKSIVNLFWKDQVPKSDKQPRLPLTETS
jgi:predicted NUDIX family phosphoesterase